MNAKIVIFSSYGDKTILEYDPATADMDEVNRVIAEYEAKTGAQPVDMATGERIEKVTREQNEILMVHPIAERQFATKSKPSSLHSVLYHGRRFGRLQGRPHPEIEAQHLLPTGKTTSIDVAHLISFQQA